MGADKFDAITRQIILRSENKEDSAEKDHDNDVTMNKLCGDTEEDNVKRTGSSEVSRTKGKSAKNKGKLIMDATVADR
ncbi:MAG: hypothetical protein IPI69_15875 [Bacteroidales bacterium]|nr:hypothetical protein [Bacteroidales bacterium]